MKLHEYQAKELFSRFGLPVPHGQVVTAIEQGLAVGEKLGYPVAIKAQVHAGGRGQAGGVRLVNSRGEATAALKAMLNRPLQTRQSGGRALLVRKVLVEQGLAFGQEYYLAVLPDRESGRLLVIASDQGGMDIEAVAARSPERIIRVQVHPLAGLQPFQQRRLAFGLGLSGTAFKEFSRLLARLYQVVMDNDLLLAEINPLVHCRDGRFVLLDAKAEVDDSALFRHQDLAALHDPDEDDPLEAEARQYGLNYIRLAGNIGTMVNGAGLAMATMDMIKQAGGAPANFLDVGGGASKEAIEQGFRILLADSQVQGILINIFGGILRCDVLAAGVVAAVQVTGLHLPLVVRMEGTNVEEGRRILADSGLDLVPATDIGEAARMICHLVEGAPGQ